jgi:thiamine-phosphate pyrophosphorylase
VPPTLCLITDARRLLTTVGRPSEAWAETLLEQIEGAIAGGIDLIQIREPRVDASALVDLTRRSVQLTRGSRARVVVNDRVDIALAAGADGVHLREDSVSLSEARRLGPGLVLGRSVHDAPGAAAARRAAYLIAGSVFQTESKPGAPARLGLDGLRRVVAAAGRVPVLAVGGVTVENLTVVLDTGVSGAAAIGAFMPEKQVSDLRAAVQTLTKNLRNAFDSPDSLS